MFAVAKHCTRGRAAFDVLHPAPKSLRLEPKEDPYPEAVFMAADIQVLNGDLGTVADLAATVSANGFKGPEEEEEEEMS